MSALAAAAARLKPLTGAVAARWSNFAPRERVLMLLFAAIALAGALYYLAVVPLRALRAEARAEIAEYGGLAARLAAIDPERLETAPAEQREGTAAGIAAAAASDIGITLTRSDPVGDGVRVQLAAVAYPLLLEWLADIERTSPLRAARIRIMRTPMAGQVRADLVLAR